MAKGKKKEIDQDSARILLDSLFAEQMQGLSPAIAAVSSVGIRIPHLCLRYLFQSTILMFERTMLIMGPPGSSKSSFLYWIYSLFLDAGGKYQHLEVEDKDTPMLRLSLTGFNRKDGRVTRCESMDHFQAQTKQSFDTMTSICERSKIGKRVPFVIGIDSLTAKMTEDAYKTVDRADGVTGRRFADEARSLSDWFKVEPKYLVGWPFILAAVRHDKPTNDSYGNLVHKGTGGTAPKYSATYEILMIRTKKFKAKMDGWEGNRIKFSTDKSSLGSDQRKFDAEIAWRPTTFVNSLGETVPSQETVWNWRKGTVELLEGLQNDGGPFGKAVDELVGLNRVRAGVYSSATLGYKGDQSLSTSEMSKVIEGNAALLSQLEPRLGIGRGVEFDRTSEFDEQIAYARSRVDDYIAQPRKGEPGGDCQPDEVQSDE